MFACVSLNLELRLFTADWVSVAFPDDLKGLQNWRSKALYGTRTWQISVGVLFKVWWYVVLTYRSHWGPSAQTLIFCSNVDRTYIEC